MLKWTWEKKTTKTCVERLSHAQQLFTGGRAAWSSCRTLQKSADRPPQQQTVWSMLHACCFFSLCLFVSMYIWSPFLSASLLSPLSHVLHVSCYSVWRLTLVFPPLCLSASSLLLWYANMAKEAAAGKCLMGKLLSCIQPEDNTMSHLLWICQNSSSVEVSEVTEWIKIILTALQKLSQRVKCEDSIWTNLDLPVLARGFCQCFTLFWCKAVWEPLR